MIDTYSIGRDGRASSSIAQPSSGQTPFGFVFDRRGRLLVSEAFGGAPGQGALSSYAIGRDGELRILSASAPNHQIATCWVVVTEKGRYAYVTNTGSDTISGYRISQDGNLTLLDADGVTGVTGAGSGPLDAALSSGSRFLYTLNGGNGTISAFRVEDGGHLTPLPGAGGLLAGVNGLAAS
jgi:6-phosphogluconolactonase (cycloisomerase 2 family)